MAARWVILITSAVSLSLSTTPCTPQVDPWTAVSTIATVIGTIAGVVGSITTAEWEHSASGKLDQIINQNGQIISTLADLKLYIPQALQETFDQEIARSAISLSQRFDQYMSGHRPDFAAIRGMRGEVEQVAYNLSGRGPSVYEAAVAATVLAIAVYKETSDVSASQKDVFLGKMLASMNKWAGNEPGMFLDAITKFQDIATNERAVIAGIPQGEVVIFQQPTAYSMPGGRHGMVAHCTLRLYARVSIDTTNYSQNVAITKTEGCFGEVNFDGDVVSSQQGNKASEIQAHLNVLHDAESRASKLINHRSALLKMISSVETLR